MPLADFCHDVAALLKGSAEANEICCKVTIPRVDLELTIMEVPTVAVHSITFQLIPNSHKALILGEFALIDEEVPHFVEALAKDCIIVSAIHNHWLFDCPHLLYVHTEARMRPKEFAQKIACILEQLSGHRYVDFDSPED